MRINKVLASIALTGLITLGAVTNTVSADERKGNGNDGCQIGEIPAIIGLILNRKK